MIVEKKNEANRLESRPASGGYNRKRLFADEFLHHSAIGGFDTDEIYASGNVLEVECHCGTGGTGGVKHLTHEVDELDRTDTFGCHYHTVVCGVGIESHGSLGSDIGDIEERGGSLASASATGADDTIGSALGGAYGDSVTTFTCAPLVGGGTVSLEEEASAAVDHLNGNLRCGHDGEIEIIDFVGLVNILDIAELVSFDSFAEESIVGVLTGSVGSECAYITKERQTDVVDPSAVGTTRHRVVFGIAKVKNICTG